MAFPHLALGLSPLAFPHLALGLSPLAFPHLALGLSPLIHEFDHRIAYADTDRMGVVYYANYLILFERGRTEWLRSLGLRYRDLEEDPGIVLPVVRAECDYLAPARYDDLIRIRTWVEEMGRAHITFRHEILDAETGKMLAKGSTKHPFVDRKTWRPVRAPAAFRAVAEKSLKA